MAISIAGTTWALVLVGSVIAFILSRYAARHDVARVGRFHRKMCDPVHREHNRLKNIHKTQKVVN